jgi:hypothetical protein
LDTISLLSCHDCKKETCPKKEKSKCEEEKRRNSEVVIQD